MPYAGLFGTYGEIGSGARGYRRIDFSRMRWNIDFSAEGYLLYSNAEMLAFPTAESEWGMITGIGLFRTAEVTSQYLLIGFSKFILPVGMNVYCRPGNIKFRSKWYDWLFESVQTK